MNLQNELFWNGDLSLWKQIEDSVNVYMDLMSNKADNQTKEGTDRRENHTTISPEKHDFIKVEEMSF